MPPTISDKSRSSGTHKKVPTINFSLYDFSFEQPPCPSPPNNVAFGKITFTVEVIVLLENIIMTGINIVLGGKGGIKSK